MRIAISGSACQGKTTLINDFIKQWPMYKRSDETYRKIIKKKNAKINKEGTKDSQRKILNAMFNDLQSTTKNDFIIYDRCCLDNLVYSLWHNAKQTSDIDDDFIKECIPIIQQSMHFIDIIFFLPITRVAPVPIEPKKHRETDPEFIREIDNIFKVISQGLSTTGKSPFFPDEDRPPIIEIFGSPEERIEMVKLYLNTEGKLIDDSQSLFSTENIDQMEALLNAQKNAHLLEKEEQRFYNKIVRGS